VRQIVRRRVGVGPSGERRPHAQHTGRLQPVGEGDVESGSLVAEVDSQLAERVMKLQKLEIELEHLIAGVRERFRGLELARVVGESEDPSGLVVRTEGMRRVLALARRAGVGPVDLAGDVVERGGQLA